MKLSLALGLQGEARGDPQLGLGAQHSGVPSSSLVAHPMGTVTTSRAELTALAAGGP